MNCAILIKVAGFGLALAFANAATADCPPGRVEIRAANGTVVGFQVEIADSTDEREIGLMDRASLPQAGGMLFVYPDAGHRYFWMKNTTIPLDMVFAGADGQVVHVQDQAVPLDLTPIDGGDGVRYVLEINGGLAQKLGIAPGGQMRSAAMDPGALAWTCRE